MPVHDKLVAFSDSIILIPIKIFLSPYMIENH